ncbi:MAG: hemerythrin domain-containing protein [Bacteroidota bacterium]|nr:hemerythrin domain-containing protein [Bacteroidota bacterium]
MSFRDPIALLMREHEEALGKLQLLKKSAQDIKKKGYSEKSFKQLLKAVEYVDEEVRHHNKHEEDALFPLVERYVDGPTTVLRDDHQKMAKIYKKLSYSIKVMKENSDDKVGRQELCESAEDIVQLMVNHIHKENHILFPMVQRFCTKEELREVAKKLL